MPQQNTITSFTGKNVLLFLQAERFTGEDVRPRDIYLTALSIHNYEMSYCLIGDLKRCYSAKKKNSVFSFPHCKLAQEKKPKMNLNIERHYGE